jgi:hypothetical protein
VAFGSLFHRTGPLSPIGALTDAERGPLSPIGSTS